MSSWYIENTSDALLVIYATIHGLLEPCVARLEHSDRLKITSGSTFCYSESLSGIKRWTDGKLWSPSRIQNEFLIYRELDSKTSIRKEFKVNGLVKKSLSCNINNQTWHVVNYYYNYDMGRLMTPRDCPAFKHLMCLLNQENVLYLTHSKKRTASIESFDSAQRQPHESDSNIHLMPPLTNNADSNIHLMPPLTNNVPYDLNHILTVFPVSIVDIG
jgi:hypothetical protein